MGNATNSLLEFASNIWNLFIALAIQMFQTDALTDPTYAAVKNTVSTCYNVVIDIAIPVATVFFLIAVIKDVEFAPADQQHKMMWSSLVKYAIILGFLAFSWQLLTLIMSATNELCHALSVTGTYTIDYNTSTLKTAVDNYYAEDLLEGFTIPPLNLNLPSVSFRTFFSDLGSLIASIFTGIIGWIFSVLGSFLGIIVVKMLIVPLLGIVGVFIMVASGISIFNSAAQRIVKPLVLIPFAGVGIAMGAGSSDYSRQASQFIKYYIGLCLSGCFMVVALNLGATLCANVKIAEAVGMTSNLSIVLGSLLQFCIMPLIITGLIKSMDSVVSHAFG